MRRSYLILFALCLSITPKTHAQFTLNPFNWFGSDEAALPIASAADEAAAASELQRAKQKFEADRLGPANRILKKLIKEYPTAKATAEALYLRGWILMTNERWRQAFDAFQRIVDEHPGFEHFDRVVGAQFECATALMEGARGRILWVLPGFKQYSAAASQFEQIVRNAPYSDYAPLALMNLALVSETRNRPEEAIDALDRLINYYPQSMLAPDAYYNLAETYASLVQGYEYDQGSTRQAISYYEDFLILFPQSNYLGEVEANLEKMENLLASSRLHIGDFYYYYRNNNTAALIFYNEAVTIAPDSEAAAEARDRIADIEAGVRPISRASILQKLLLAD